MTTPAWNVALDQLIARNKNFVADKMDGMLQDSIRRQALMQGQEPFAVIVGCADSRVVPELTFDAGLGELFVIRVAGNVANQSTIGSVEYAVEHLGVQLVLVVGHEGCGAVTAAIGGGDLGENINHLLGFIKPAIEQAGTSDVNTVVRANAQLNAKAMLAGSDILQKAHAEDRLRLVPAYYHLDSGRVEILE